MGRNLEISDIGEFSGVSSIPNGAIDEKIINNIKDLNEKTQLEPFLQEILHHPDDTPHGPTEKADILTSNVHVNNTKRVAAFVLKGKSPEKVKSKDVTYQFSRLERIPDLDLMVLVAVGNIQDNAKVDFIQSASNKGCNYLIINAFQLARLLIAYQKICPKDGTVYEAGECQEGHKLDEGIKIEMSMEEEPKYEPLKLEDVSHAGAKRYSGKLVIDKHYPKETLKNLIVEATEDLKNREYYRNSQLENRWGNQKAHVVWLFIGYSQKDIQLNNWVCRSCWIDPNLDESMKPMGLDADETIEGIDIKWEEDYEERKEWHEKESATKGELLEKIDSVLPEMEKLGKRATKLFKRYKSGEIERKEFLNFMKQQRPKVSELFDKAGDFPFPPTECDDFDQACRNLFATVDNMFLYYSEEGGEARSEENQDYLMNKAIEDFNKELQKVEYEREKLH